VFGGGKYPPIPPQGPFKRLTITSTLQDDGSWKGTSTREFPAAAPEVTLGYLGPAISRDGAERWMAEAVDGLRRKGRA
jgi:hypothetical protein